MIRQIIVRTENHTVVSTNDIAELGLHSVIVYDENDEIKMHCSCDKFIDDINELVKFIKHSEEQG